ncbi:MAG TPA: sugar ABC transporter ATP-binding protein, partial [Tepidisphaeraceae bacterium]|nr:sugar ABC transporter ATP-binding protein [Tepidisphaeraceae bacterium]
VNDLPRVRPMHPRDDIHQRALARPIFPNRQPTRELNLIDWGRLNEMTRSYLKLFELDIDPGTPVKELSVAHRQVVEILKAMSHRPCILILDEPTSSLTSQETRLLIENIRRLKREGVAFIYISHHLSEIFEIADRVTVMRDGQYVETFEVGNVDEETLVRKMVGRELSNVYGQRQSEIGEVYFEVKGAGRRGGFADVNFSLRKGEILGLAGLVGAGRTELGRAIAGIEPMETGQMLLEGRAVRIRTPGQAIGQRIGYLTEDRKEQGLFLRMPIRDNCAAPSLRRFASWLGWMNDSAVGQFAENNRRDFNIVTPGVWQRVGNLSGGNQQKVLLSMWMGIGPKVLIVDEPTRGVDVGARSEIYALLRQLAAKGVGIIMISSDLQEILGLSDRVLVMREGRIAAELPRQRATEETLIAAATGVELN